LKGAIYTPVYIKAMKREAKAKEATESWYKEGQLYYNYVSAKPNQYITAD
jgi:hypothetical protein